MNNVAMNFLVMSFGAHVCISSEYVFRSATAILI